MIRVIKQKKKKRKKKKRKNQVIISIFKTKIAFYVSLPSLSFFGFFFFFVFLSFFALEKSDLIELNCNHKLVSFFYKF